MFDELKQSPEAKVSQLAVAANANNPTCMFAMAAQQLFSRHSFVYSNVPVRWRLLRSARAGAAKCR